MVAWCGVRARRAATRGELVSAGVARFAGLHPAWREALACHEALRRLGYDAEEIFLSRHDDGRLLLLIPRARYGLVVNPRGGGGRDLAGRSPAELAAEWAAAAREWNEATPEEMDALFQGSAIRGRSLHLAMDLGHKGIVIPAACDA